MNRVIKSIILVALIVQLVALVGCGKTVESQTAMGRYIEQAIEIEGVNAEEQQFIVQSKSGILNYFTLNEEGMSCYTQQEDLTFQPTPLSWSKTYSEMVQKINGSITAMGCDQNDCIYMVVVGAEEGYESEEFDTAHTRTYILKVENDKITQTVLNIEDNLPYIMPSNIEILENGDCLVGGGYRGVSQFNLETGNRIKNYAPDEQGKFIVSDEKLYILSMQNQAIEVYDLSSGQKEQEISCEAIDEETCMMSGEEGIYLMNKTGIWHKADDGEIWEQLMEGTGVSIGLPSYHLQKAFLVKGQFIAHLIDADWRCSLKAYTYSETTPTKPEVELTAYMLEDNQTLREMLISYELAHPEVRINVQQGVDEVGGVSQDDAIKALNTELLAGEGPDILLLDDLERETYVDKGLLVNLDEVVDQAELVPQIRSNFKEEKGTFMIPLRFAVPCLIGNQEILDEVSSIPELMAYQKAHMNTPIFCNINQTALYERIAPFTSNQWLSQEGQFDGDKVSTFLEGINDLTSFYEQTDESLQGNSGLAEAFSILIGESQAEVWDITGIEDLFYIKDLMEKKQDTGLKVVHIDDKASFKPTTLIGINQNSKHKEIAKEIIGFMLSEELQKVDTKEGFPVQKVALQKWLNGENTNKNIYVGIGNDKVTLDAYWRSEEELSFLIKAIETIEVPVMSQPTLERIILEEAQSYLAKEKSLDEVMQTLESKVALYQEG